MVKSSELFTPILSIFPFISVDFLAQRFQSPDVGSRWDNLFCEYTACNVYLLSRIEASVNNIVILCRSISEIYSGFICLISVPSCKLQN